MKRTLLPRRTNRRTPGSKIIQLSWMFKLSAMPKSNSWRASLKILRSRICSIRCFNSRWWELKPMNKQLLKSKSYQMGTKAKVSLILTTSNTRSKLLPMPQLLSSNSRLSKSWPLRFKPKFKSRSPTSKRLLRWCRCSKVNQMIQPRRNRCSNTLITSRSLDKTSWTFNNICLSNKRYSNSSKKLAFWSSRREMLSMQSGNRLKTRSKQMCRWLTNNSKLLLNKPSRLSRSPNRLKLTKPQFLNRTKATSTGLQNQHRTILFSNCSIVTRLFPKKLMAKCKSRCNCSRCLHSSSPRTWRSKGSKSKLHRSSSSILSWAKSSSKWLSSCKLISSRSSWSKGKDNPMLGRAKSSLDKRSNLWLSSSKSFSSNSNSK